MPANIAVIATTTNNSTNVNPTLRKYMYILDIA
jgi:hypothetical protein